MGNKLISIIGASESGVGAAVLAKKQGYEVFVSDYGRIQSKYEAVLLKEGIAYEQNGHSIDKVLQAGCLVKSPGVPNNASLIQQAKAKGIKVLSEIEWASQFTKAKIIAVTGSNGKTTTASWLFYLLKLAGFNVGLAGNIGDSFAWSVANDAFDYYVLEVSSFQLDDIVYFKPYIAILTNITPDHLDRYNYDMEAYAKAKFLVTKNQTKNDFFITNFDDDGVKKYWQNNIEATVYGFATKQLIKKGAYANQNDIVVQLAAEKPIVLNKNIVGLKGKHNLLNAMAVLLAANLLKVDQKIVAEALTGFNTLEHRLELVATIKGIEFINDSKATNIDAAWYALDAMTKPVIWVAGGIDKGNDYQILQDLVQNKVRAIVCLGVDNTKIYAAFNKCVEIITETKNAGDAVKMAYKMAKNKEVVLLSPACSSFDLFHNYMDRGNQFKKEVNALKAKVEVENR